MEIRANQQDGSEVDPLPVESLLACTLCSSCLHGFLRRMEITHDSKAVGFKLPGETSAQSGVGLDVRSLS